MQTSTEAAGETPLSDPCILQDLPSVRVLTGDRKGHGWGLELCIRDVLRSAGELGIRVFLPRRVLQRGGGGWKASNGVDLYRGMDGNPWAVNKQLRQRNNSVVAKTLDSRCPWVQNKSRLQKNTSSPVTAKTEKTRTGTFDIQGLSIKLISLLFGTCNLCSRIKIYKPFPSATRGLLFFNHVIFAAGLASCAMHFPSCGTNSEMSEKWGKYLSYLFRVKPASY